MSKGKLVLVMLAGVVMLGLAACATEQPRKNKGGNMTDDQAVWGN